MKRIVIIIVLLSLLLPAGCQQESGAPTDFSTAGTTLPDKPPSDSSGGEPSSIPSPATENETEPDTREEAGSNWEAAQGYYYREGYEYILEVIYGGSADNRTYNLVLWDQENTMILSLYDMKVINQTDIRGEKAGVDYLFRYDPNGGNPKITLSGSKNAAAYQGDYFMVKG